MKKTLTYSKTYTSATKNRRNNPHTWAITNAIQQARGKTIRVNARSSREAYNLRCNLYGKRLNSQLFFSSIEHSGRTVTIYTNSK